MARKLKLHERLIKKLKKNLWNLQSFLSRKYVSFLCYLFGHSNHREINSFEVKEGRLRWKCGRCGKYFWRKQSDETVV